MDHCAPCNAVWLDGGELADLELGGRRSEEQLRSEADCEVEREGSRSVVNLDLCPRCQGSMANNYIAGVQVDECGRCGGIFFDQGELKAVLDARRVGVIRRVFRRFRRAAERVR